MTTTSKAAKEKKADATTRKRGDSESSDEVQIVKTVSAASATACDGGGKPKAAPVGGRPKAAPVGGGKPKAAPVAVHASAQAVWNLCESDDEDKKLPAKIAAIPTACRDCGAKQEQLVQGLCKKCTLRSAMAQFQEEPESPPQQQQPQHDQKRASLNSTDRAGWVVAQGNGGRSLSVDKELAKHLKPHQKEGVSFIFRHCFSDFVDGHGSNLGGCICAHYMGLGKSLTTIALLHSVMAQACMGSKKKAKPKAVFTVLMLVPMNTLFNWENESDKWTGKLTSPLRMRNLGSVQASYRSKEIGKWKHEGGILVMSEALFLRLSTTIINTVQPNVLVLDEAHTMLKNMQNKVAKELAKIQTKRKILLTGTPLQNDVTEMYRMVDFVRPRVLEGVRSENDFESFNPIEAGLAADAPEDKKNVSRSKQLELYKKFEPYIHRKGRECLWKDLPPLHDTLLYLQPSETQKMIMRFYCKHEKEIGDENFFRKYQNIAPLLNHPGCLEPEAVGLKRKRETNNQWLIDAIDGTKKLSHNTLHETWRSPKFIILSHILAMASERDEKTIVYSKCLRTLDLVGQFLEFKDWTKPVSSLAHSFPGKKIGGFEKNKHYLRIDGSIDSGKRGTLVEKFNETDVRVFLIASLAGGIGINLTSATRVVILDNHFNPTVSEQCIARAHRYGQKKHVHCYRLAIEGTLEAKVYARAANKSGVASGVVDGELRPQRYTREEMADLNKIDISVECSKCGKSHKLSPEDNLSENDQDRWVCSMNKNPMHQKCKAKSTPQQTATDSEDPILKHLKAVVNKRTKRTELVTECVAVHSSSETIR